MSPTRVYATEYLKSEPLRAEASRVRRLTAVSCVIQISALIYGIIHVPDIRDERVLRSARNDSVKHPNPQQCCGVACNASYFLKSAIDP